MRTLVVTSRVPDNRASGYDLRVDQLARLTPGERHLAVVPLVPGSGESTEYAALDGFDSVRRIDALAHGKLSPRRHARVSDSRYLRLSRRRAFEEAREQLSNVVTELEIDWIVTFGGDLAELVFATGHSRTILDVCDSVSLTLRRQFEVRPPEDFLGRLKDRLDVVRARSHEARLPSQFRFVTAISEQDSGELRGLAGTAPNVVTIPNGVDEAFLGGMLPAGRRRGVAFWGNLDFEPNEEALRYFLVEIYRPYLREQDVQVRIIGANAPDWLVDMARADQQIELMGYVHDLPQAVAEFPVAVNAMRTGSGLKNKVLEAFGLGLVVVSTTRGVEALASVRAGTHVVVADDAHSFALAVLEVLADEPERDRIRSAAHALLIAAYPWPVVGESWRALFSERLPQGTSGGRR